MELEHRAMPLRRISNIMLSQLSDRAAAVGILGQLDKSGHGGFSVQGQPLIFNKGVAPGHTGTSEAVMPVEQVLIGVCLAGIGMFLDEGYDIVADEKGNIYEPTEGDWTKGHGHKNVFAKNWKGIDKDAEESKGRPWKNNWLLYSEQLILNKSEIQLLTAIYGAEKFACSFVNKTILAVTGSCNPLGVVDKDTFTV